LPRGVVWASLPLWALHSLAHWPNPSRASGDLLLPPALSCICARSALAVVPEGQVGYSSTRTARGRCLVWSGRRRESFPRSWSCKMRAHTHARTHTCPLAHTCARTHAFIRAHTHIDSTCTHPHTHTTLCPRTHPHPRTRTRPRTHPGRRYQNSNYLYPYHD
jgi:hypothetical protein